MLSKLKLFSSHPAPEVSKKTCFDQDVFINKANKMFDQSYFSPEGVCQGLTLVWLYFMWKNREEKLKFYMFLILTESTENLLKQKKAIAPFLAMIKFAQDPEDFILGLRQWNINIILTLLPIIELSSDPIKTLDLFKSWESTATRAAYFKKNPPNLYVEYKASAAKSDAKDLQAKLDCNNQTYMHLVGSFEYDGKNIFSRKDNVHCIGLFRKGKEFFLFDCNDSCIEPAYYPNVTEVSQEAARGLTLGAHSLPETVSFELFDIRITAKSSIS